ncbi:hypothetical protein [Floridanema evergladense]|uniref:Uncharacterized protein n=1 Tax=Floridaenema evergladense BLCC-F167 TaxID=3153639 RepID=A0ABV4WDK7_9CYAN
MARPYISPDLRRLVAQRADGLCEYCLISESDRTTKNQLLINVNRYPSPEALKQINN